MFYKEGEFDFKKDHPGWTKWFVTILFIAIVLIFLNSIMYNDTDKSWLDYGLEYAITNITGPVVTSIIFVAIAIAAIMYITGSLGKGSGAEKKKEK